MILGVLSDSHGHPARVKHALQILETAGAQAFIHCGDVGSEAVIDALAGRQAWFVWGNTDQPAATMRAYIDRLGLHYPDKVPLDIELAGKRIRVGHGHERTFDALLEAHENGSVHRTEDEADFLLHGHTHAARYELLPSGAYVMNPGALHRALTHTVATLDLSSSQATYWVVDEASDPSQLVQFELD